MKLTQKQSKIIESFELSSPKDILTWFPLRYENRDAIDPSLWQENDKILVEVTITSPFKTVRFGRNQSLVRFTCMHGTYEFQVTVFNQPYLRQSDYDKRCLIYGTYKGSDKIQAIKLSHTSLDEFQGIHPIYPLKKDIKNYEVVKIVEKALALDLPSCSWPENFDNLMPIREAIIEIHQPKSTQSLSKAIYALKYIEFLHYFYRIKQRPLDQSGSSKVLDVQKIVTLSSTLPFALTQGQKDVINELVADLLQPQKMMRLLQGDVGSGKTIVSLLVAAALEGQTALMAPTEILAYQHYQTAKTILNDDVVLLTSDIADRKDALERIKNGQVKLIIGTHALFQKEVEYHHLVWAIIDEQHRFGVNQRQALINKGENVDVLMLSATPIPRTLATTLFLDMKVSDLPMRIDRSDIVDTVFIQENSLRSIVNALEVTISMNQQVYVICPAITSEPGMRGVVEMQAQLSNVFPNARVVYLHGGMSSSDKQRIIDEFKAGLIQVLVATSIVEVGVDAKNATAMVIYNAERFGLATLHQLRGRIGRHGLKSTCYLLSDAKTEEAEVRLNALVDEHDGFKLSSLDLKLRGAGDLLGTKQSGLPTFVLGNIIDDTEIIEKARYDLEALIHDHDLKKFLSCASFYYPLFGV